MNEKKISRITERLAEIVEEYSVREVYSNSNLRLNDMVKWPGGKEIWIAMYEVPINGSSRAIILKRLPGEHYRVSGKNLSWTEKEQEIKLRDEGSAFKEFEQRVKEIPSDIKNIFV